MKRDEPPPLRVGSFAAHATRGLVRDRRMRRRLMLGSVIMAVLLMICGMTLVQRAIDPHRHPLSFLLYWGACGWITFLALLLALYDLLLTRREGRALREELERRVAPPSATSPPNARRD